MVLRRIFSILIILSTLTFFACAQGPNSPMGTGAICSDTVMVEYLCG